MARTRPATRYLTFLRGIIVGGRRVKMDALRDLFAGLGLANVATYIASGNVLFDAPGGDPSALESRIEEHLRSSLGFEVETFLRTSGELAEVAAFRPFPSGDLDASGHTLHVGFLRGIVPEADARRMLGFRIAMDDFLVHGRELHWLCRGKTTDSLVSWPAVAKAVRAPSTMRNMTTVRKLSALYPPV